jgi:predicted HTH domain antitoxin
MELQLTLPDDMAFGLKIPAEKIKQEILKEVGIIFYAQGKASMGVARKISGMGKRAFMEELAIRKIPRHYSEKDFDVDFDYAKAAGSWKNIDNNLFDAILNSRKA